uniref:Methionine synthase reductase n=1 Tax=Callorhinchus milii TaxID=7868 RepID=V9KHA8_CALMI
MTLEIKPQFLLLYGSELGQAKAIAEDIFEQACRKGFISDIHCLSHLDQFNLEKARTPVVLVVSTTGSGELPRTVRKFAEEINCKYLPADHYSHLRYAVLALGDSNYLNFANGGKIIDRLLQQLGAQHFYATGYADDSVGLELVVEPWIEGLWAALRESCLCNMSVCQETEEMSTAVKKTSETNDCTGTSEIEGAQNSLITEIQLMRLEDPRTDASVLSTSCTGQDQVAAEMHSFPLPTWVRSEQPLSESALNIPNLPSEYLNVEFLENTEQVCVLECLPMIQHTVFQVPVTRVMRLTREDAVKTTLLLELDISKTSFTYDPGDAFNILCPNSRDEVEELIQRLGLQYKREHCVSISIRTNTKKKCANLPEYIPERSTLQFILTWCLEIRSIPKKAFIRALAEYTSDAGEKRRLQELSSKQGAADYNRHIRDCRICLLDILHALPSCHPPLSLLIEHLPKLQVRSYSAASSPNFYPGKIHFVFNIIEFPSCPERPVARRGVCTGWLAEQVTPMLQYQGKPVEDANGLQNGLITIMPQISIYSRPNAFFHLPNDPVVPIIMVGPGTGLAPFIGFLQHRQKQREQNPDGSFGETWLFFGCCHQDRDYLFRDDLNEFQNNGTLTHLKVCFSRDLPKDATEEKPKYVQHNLQLFSQDVAKLLLNDNGCFYVCGDAKNMAKDVNNVLTEIVSKEMQVDTLEAMKIIASLRDEKRYLQDTWT